MEKQFRINRTLPEIFCTGLYQRLLNDLVHRDFCREREQKKLRNIMETMQIMA